jgi:hypothetical protein
MKEDRYEYVINADDVITRVNSDWEAFARENGAEGLPASAIGTWLWQHFGGMEVKHLYRALLDRVRESGVKAEVPFRCDSPGTRRFMSMAVEPLDEGAVLFSTWTVREEDRPPVEILAPADAQEEGAEVVMCAWCKKVDSGESGWAEVEEALGRLEVLNRDHPPRITHGVCPECRARVIAEPAEGS